MMMWLAEMVVDKKFGSKKKWKVMRKQAGCAACRKSNSAWQCWKA